MKKQCFSAGG